MFTGIISNLGKVKEVKLSKKNDLLLKISSEEKLIRSKLEIGCSIACNGICLTLIKKEIAQKNITLSFQVSAETCDKTDLKNWKIGKLINLEFAMKIGDELGGHIVLGHVDGTVKVKALKQIQNSHQFTFSAEKNLMRFIASKGSVTLNGVSLTVNEVKKNSFNVNIIPHTFHNTSFQNLKISDLVNLEIDPIARYVERLQFPTT